MEEMRKERNDGVATRRNSERTAMAIEEYAVDWNGPSTPSPRLRLLLLADVDLASAGRVVKWAIQGGNTFDLCAVCGDFIPRPDGWSTKSETQEQLSAEEGEMSATLAQLENTVCRVVYVPGPLDPIMPSIRKPRRRPSSSLANGNVGASTPYTSVPLTAKVEEGHQRRREGGTVEQRDQRRWKGVKEGGEREQGIGDDFGGGGRRRSREERMAGGEGVLQLTPTSKNLLRRNLRLAPGLSAAGFTEERRGNERSNNEDDRPGDASLDGRNLAMMRSLCRGSGGTRRPRGSRTPSISPAPSLSSSSSASTSIPVSRENVDAAGRKATDTAVAAQSTPESVILMTRVGGPRGRAKRSARPGGKDPAGYKNGNVNGAANGTPKCNADNDVYKETPCSAGDGAVDPKVSEAAAAAQLQRLWLDEDRRVRSEKRASGDEQELTGKILLHACSGPGASLAVRQALGEDGKEQRRRQGFPRTEGGTVGGEGVGCRIGGCTVVALGSLRSSGEYCIVELDMPSRSQTQDDGGWSVAGVEFGRICLDDKGDRGMSGVS